MSKTILLADDSLTIQKVVELTFMEEDYQVVAVGNGDEAIAKLAELSPVMVVADVHMPGASGYEVCRQAKAAHPGVPVLLLVGTFEPFEEAEHAACGADGVLKKPFDSQELLRLAGEMVAAGGGAQEADDEPDTAEFQPPSDADLPEVAAPTPGPALAGAAEAALPALEQPTAEFRLGGPPTGEISLAEEVALPSLDDAPGLALGAEPEGIVRPAAAGVPEEEPAAPEAAVTEDAPATAAAAPAEPAVTEPAAEPAAAGAPLSLSDVDIERIARRVVELLSDTTVREVTWDVVPDLAEIVIKDRLRELESQVD